MQFSKIVFVAYHHDSTNSTLINADNSTTRGTRCYSKSGFPNENGISKFAVKAC